MRLRLAGAAADAPHDSDRLSAILGPGRTLREHGGIVTERRSLNSDVGTHVTVPGVDCPPPRKNRKLTAHSRPMLSSRETSISTEIELKLAARTADLPALRRALAAMAKGKKTTRAKLVSTYYDTDDRALARRGCVLRVRHHNGHFVQTVKTEGASGASALA